jgi:hypothetical protein
MSRHTYYQAPGCPPQQRELAHSIERKAARFAAAPETGYLAGYSPRVQQLSLDRDARLCGVRRWSAELAWLYAVAEQDLPTARYQWEIIEEIHGAFRLVVACHRSDRSHDE